MAESCGCNPTDSVQPFPTTGILAQNLNKPLDEIRRLVGEEDALVYFYNVDSIKRNGKKFIQTGCGPNWQGDVISLSTCKHMMRSLRPPEEWPGVWVAGFSGKMEGDGRNALVYLMQVGHAFPNHQAVWYSRIYTPETLLAKSAHLDRFGDLFMPLGFFTCGTDPEGYQKPVADHAHIKNAEWRNDIRCDEYLQQYKRRPALLFGDPQASFLWDEPMVFINKEIGIGVDKEKARDFLTMLEV